MFFVNQVIPETHSGLSRLPATVEDAGSIPGGRRYPGEGNGNPFQYFCLGNPTDRGAWRATFHGVAKIQTQLSDLNIHPHVRHVCLPALSQALFF